MPDFYQGTELVDSRLVDPDNRRPVDYALRERLLESLGALRDAGDASRVPELLARPDDGRAKLWLAWRTLALRKRDPALFEHGDYAPLAVTGAKAAHVVAFARRHEGRTLVAIAGRLFFALTGEAGRPPLGLEVWLDTAVDLAPLGDAGPFVDALTGETLRIEGRQLALGRAFDRFPVALLYADAPQVASSPRLAPRRKWHDRPARSPPTATHLESRRADPMTAAAPPDPRSETRAATGIEGLDDILGGGLTAAPAVPGRRRARLRQDHARAAVPARGRPARRAGPVRHPLGDRRGAARGRRLARLVARRHHHPRAGPVRGQPAARRAVHDVPPVRGGAERDDQDDPRRTSSGSSRRGSCSIRSRSCGCWPATRCATAGRSWRSSSSSPAAAAPSCCSTT